MSAAGRPTIPCLGHYLTKIVIRGYQGSRAHTGFTRFFVANASVLRVMNIAVPRKVTDKWMANQRKVLRTDCKASADAEIRFTYYYLRTEMDCAKRTHDLSVTDPFDL
jgi:hypothetical protein